MKVRWFEHILYFRFMTLFTQDNHQECAKLFLERYELQRILTCLSEKPKNLRPRKDRVCRFCGLREPLTSFKKIAHVIPNLLGNHNLISDFECDACNEKFGIYENDLANYLAITRTLNGTKSNKKIPKYKSFDEYFAVENDNFQTDETGSIFIARHNPDEHSLSINADKGTLVMSYPMKPYIPLRVYKSVLKIALSSLPEKELGYYRHALKYVTSTDIDRQVIGVHRVCMYSMTLGINYAQPMALLFKKRHPSEEIFSHWFHLYFQNFIFQLFIPLNENDVSFCNREILVDFAPPLFTEIETAEAAFRLGLSSQLLDLSSTEVRKNDKGTFSMYMGVDQLTSIGLIDPLTGKAKIDENALKTISGIKLSRQQTM